MLPRFLSAVLAGFILVLSTAAAFASELKTQYTTVTYDKEEQMRKFNKGVSLGSLS